MAYKVSSGYCEISWSLLFMSMFLYLCFAFYVFKRFLHIWWINQEQHDPLYMLNCADTKPLCSMLALKFVFKTLISNYMLPKDKTIQSFWYRWPRHRVEIFFFWNQ